MFYVPHISSLAFDMARPRPFPSSLARWDSENNEDYAYYHVNM